MGLDSNVLAIGPFHPSIVDCLDYGAEYYEGVTEGSMVISTLFQCDTSSESRDVVQALGCEVWKFKTHLLDQKNFDWTWLTEAYPEETEILRKLLAREFVLLFQPNG